MAAKTPSNWTTEIKGRHLPKGVRARWTKHGRARLYCRYVDARGKQTDEKTPWYADEPGAIDRAAHMYYELRAGVADELRASQREFESAHAASSKARPELELDAEGRVCVPQGSIADILDREYRWWSRPGRPRQPTEHRSWKATAVKMAEIFSPETLVTDLTTDDLQRFMAVRTAYGTCGPATALRNLTVLRNAIRRAVSDGYITMPVGLRWPVARDSRAKPVDEKKQAHVIPAAELNEFFDALRTYCNRLDDSQSGRWVYHLFKFSLATGLRAGEIAKLRVRDVTPTALFVHPKCGVPDWESYYGAHASSIAQAVIAGRGLTDPDARVFGNGNDRALMYHHTKVTQRVNKKLGRTLPIKLRDMRATSARWIYDGAGQVPADGTGSAKDIKGAQRWLRHADLTQTQRYLRLGKSEVVTAINPMAQL